MDIAGNQRHFRSGLNQLYARREPGTYQTVISEIKGWSPTDAIQKEMKQKCLKELEQNGSLLIPRSPKASHITVSCFIFSPDFEQTLLCLHKKGKFWVQLGGHLESDDESLFLAAIREVAEESAITSFDAIADEIFDIDTHRLSAEFTGCSEHTDFGFVATTKTLTTLFSSPESQQLGWWPVSELPIPSGPSLPRRVENARNWGIQHLSFNGQPQAVPES